MRHARSHPTRSQPVGVWDDLSTDRGVVYTHVGFGGVVLVPIVLRKRRPPLTGWPSHFLVN
jgi:hypothetical protein